MADVSEFEPRELDLLEDALEGLEGAGDLAELGLDDRLTARLAEYRHILAMSRESLELEEVPAGLLDNVIAEASRTEASPVVVTATASGGEPSDAAAGPWWQRWRRWMVPTLALAGSAAAVLWIVAPETEGEVIISEAGSVELDASPEEKASRDQRGLGGVVPGETAARPTVPAAAPVDRDEEAKAEEAMVDDLAVGDGQGYGGGFSKEAAKQAELHNQATRPAKKGKADAKPSSGAGAGVIEGADTLDDDAEAEASLDKDGVWTHVEDGERALGRGNCTAAKRSFKKVLASPKADALALARAHAGVGVCLEWEGDVKSASSAFDQARLFQPGDAGNDLISAQRNRLPPPSEQKSAPKKKSAASSDQAQDL